MKKVLIALLLIVFTFSSVSYIKAAPNVFEGPGDGGGTTYPNPDPDPDPEPEPLENPLHNGYIDLDSDSFGTKEYAVAEWKYDFVQMFENYENSWNMNDAGSDFNYVYYFSRSHLLDENVLPRVLWNDFDTGEEQMYYFYKSQIIPHNEYVYDELLTVLETYKLIVEHMVEDYEELSDMYFDTFINTYVSTDTSGVDGFNDYISIIMDAVDEYEQGETINTACEIITESSQIDDKYKEYVKLSCSSILNNVVDYSEAGIRGYLDDKDFLEIVGSMALDIGIDILNNTAKHVIKKYAPGINVIMTTGDVLNSIYALAMSNMYDDLADATAEVYEAIDPAMEMIVVASVNPHLHLRIDYLVGDFTDVNDPGMFNNYDYLSPYTIEEAAENMETDFDLSYTKGLFFQLVSTSVLTEEWLPNSSDYGHTIRGNLSVYSADDFVNEFTDLIYHQTNLVPIYPHRTYYSNSAQYLFG